LEYSIIESDDYQRMKKIKQLGHISSIFKSAIHTRYQHCIGACILAQQAMNTLKKQIDSSNVLNKFRFTELDEICVRIAALCHDLGHNFMSHDSDAFFKEASNKKFIPHEELSFKIFLKIINQDHLQEMMTDIYNMNIDITDETSDLNFIRDLIFGVFDSLKRSIWPKRRQYLLDIVANGVNGMDVDKFDYILRDSSHLNIHREVFDRNDLNSLIENYRIVITDQNLLQASFHTDAIPLLKKVWDARYSLTKDVYLSPQCRIINSIWKSILLSVKDIDLFEKGVALKDAQHDLNLFLRLNDDFPDKLRLLRLDTNLSITLNKMLKLLNRQDSPVNDKDWQLRQLKTNISDTLPVSLPEGCFVCYDVKITDENDEIQNHVPPGLESIFCDNIDVVNISSPVKAYLKSISLVGGSEEELTIPIDFKNLIQYDPLVRVTIFNPGLKVEEGGRYY